MPKAANDALIWSTERASYELIEQGGVRRRALQEEDSSWQAWLNSHASFAFQGKHGHMTLRKDWRKAGGSRQTEDEAKQEAKSGKNVYPYWYAYRNQGSRTVKKYVGRDADLTIARLEETASILADMTAPGQNAHSQTATTGSDEPLLEPKLRLPRLHPGLVARERLLERLNGGLERRLTLLSAPAGFGKTTLVSQWLAAQRSVSVAWVALDSGDNDPVRFWRYVSTACQIFQEDVGKVSLAHLLSSHASWHPAFGQSALDAALTAFLNELAYLQGQGALVLEDYHAITTPQIHETLSNFIEHLPPTLHVILISRGDPPLPLARWRARDELVELRAADLRFSQQETSDFLRQAVAFPLSVEAVRRLDTRTEGWAAGLRLLALALQGQATEQEANAFLASFDGSQRHLLEYFVSETLAAQPEALQNFLLRTSTLKRLTASLCDAVVESNNSAENLAALERANLFLQPLDGVGQWYRYHALFAEAMQYEARRRLGEDALRACFSRASLWYEQHEMPEEAVDAAFAAADVTRAIALVEKLVETFFEPRPYSGVHEIFTFHRWLEQVPDEELQKHPSICLAYAVTLAFTAGGTLVIPPEIEAILQMAERIWRTEQNAARLGAIFALRSLILVWQNDFVQSEAMARLALDCLPETEITWRSAALSIAGAGEVQRGQINMARQTIMQALALSEEIANPHMTRPVLLVLGEIYWLQNELRQAEALYRRAYAEADDDPADKRRASLGLARLSYEWNMLDAAQQYAQQAIDLGKQLSDEAVQVRATLLLARVQHARGDAQQAYRTLQTLLAWMQPSKSPLLNRDILACQAALQLTDGDLSATQRWTIMHNDGHTQIGRDTLTPTEPQIESEELLVARLLIAQDRANEALDALNRWLAAAQEAGRIRSVLTIHILASLAYSSRKQTQKAAQQLQEALALAHSADCRRIFLDEGEPIAALLRIVIPGLREEPLIAYAQSLLDAFSGHQDNRAVALLIEPLSIQERRVLRLLAAGHSRQEIAAELVISLNTVKTHLQHIYQKLNVSSNREAREAARRLRLV